VNGAVIQRAQSSPVMSRASCSGRVLVMADLRLSVIVPAFNEQKLLAHSLSAIRASVSAAGFSEAQWELRVCDNNSSDDTARIAVAAGAVVVFEGQQQIARARNTGAADARGEWLLFVDADTTPSSELLAATRTLMENGTCCAAGAIIAPVDTDGRELSLLPKALVGGWNMLSRLLRVVCGAYVLCRRDAFRDLGGFNSELYAAEELDLSWRLRKWGRQHGLRVVIITSARLNTSMRKLELYSPSELLGMLGQVILHPVRALKSRRYLDHWYDGRR
jgi:glycosyltransferase involved in cell wall biosynthesis